MIVTKDQLRDYMSGIGLTSYQSQAADDVLRGTQARLERHLRRRLELHTVTAERLRTLPGGWLDTEWDPVVSVSTAGYTIGSDGLVWPDYSTPILLGTPATITYVAGFDGTQPEFADVRLAILRVAAREMDARHGKARTVRGTTTTKEPQEDTQRRGIGWTAEELEEFSHLRRRVTA